jgi:hypothetical protein
MSPVPKLSDFPQGGRVALPGFTAPALHDRVQATIAATRGQYPPTPAPFARSGAAADDATARTKAALPPTPRTTEPRPMTPAEKDVANLPDAGATVQAIINKSHRMAEAGASDEAEKIRREG